MFCMALLYIHFGLTDSLFIDLSRVFVFHVCFGFFVDFNFLVFFSLSLGLLCGDFVPDRDRHSSSSNSPDPPVVPEGYLLARICSQRPGPDEGQVSKRITCTY